MFVVYQHPSPSFYYHGPSRNYYAARCAPYSTMDTDDYLALRLGYIQREQSRLHRESEYRRRLKEALRLRLEYEQRRQALASVIAHEKRKEAARRRALWIQQQRERRQKNQVFGVLFNTVLQEALTRQNDLAARHKAATKIQRFYRRHHSSAKSDSDSVSSSPAVTAKLDSLTDIEAHLNQLQLQLGEKARGKSTLRKFLGLEEDIIKVLLQLDAVQSEGEDVVRQRRKSLVETAQNVLDAVDVERKKFENNTTPEATVLAAESSSENVTQALPSAQVTITPIEQVSAIPVQVDSTPVSIETTGIVDAPETTETNDEINDETDKAVEAQPYIVKLPTEASDIASENSPAAYTTAAEETPSPTGEAPVDIVAEFVNDEEQEDEDFVVVEDL